MDVHTSKHMKMAEAEAALDHGRRNRSNTFICSRVGASLVHKSTHTLLNYTLPKLRKIILEAMDSINPETVQIL